MEILNLVEKLKDCPKGTKLYSPLFGEMEFLEIDDGVSYPIKLRDIEQDVVNFTRYGKYINCENGECLLFPSKDNRDWSTFKVEQSKSKQKPQKFEPKQWVLVRNEYSHDLWRLGIFSHYDDKCTYRYACMSGNWSYCIPYEGNEDLLGTADEPKE